MVFLFCGVNVAELAVFGRHVTYDAAHMHHYMAVSLAHPAEWRQSDNLKGNSTLKVMTRKESDGQESHFKQAASMLVWVMDEHFYECLMLSFNDYCLQIGQTGCFQGMLEL